MGKVDGLAKSTIWFLCFDYMYDASFDLRSHNASRTFYVFL